jgi:internalin A
MKRRDIFLIAVVVLVIIATSGFLIIKPKKENEKIVQCFVTDKEAISLYHTWIIDFDKDISNEDLQGFEVTVRDSLGKDLKAIWLTGADGRSVQILPPKNGYKEEEYILEVEANIPFTVNGDELIEKELRFTPRRAYNNEKVVIKDGNFEEVVREIINKPEGDLYINDLESVTSIIANGRQIKDISGIEYLVNLREAYLDVNEIVDITPISGLAYIERLGLSQNRITDISKLNGLKLKYLSLYGNDIKDYSAVKEVYQDLEWKDFTVD